MASRSFPSLPVYIAPSGLCPRCPHVQAWYVAEDSSLQIFYNFIYLFLAVLALCCCTGFFLVAASGGYSRVAACGLLIAVASIVAESGLLVRGLSSGGTWA